MNHDSERVQAQPMLFPLCIHLFSKTKTSDLIVHNYSSDLALNV
uniref:Uncharacterized protein n=1 Tax=Anguilla anguilla TaxID=7936 RepID=A0A0E9SXQ4_ANGAN